MRALFYLLFLCVSPALAAPLHWRLQHGIELTTVRGKLTILRADPRLTPLELIHVPKTPVIAMGEIAARENFSVLTNAAMFVKDYETSFGYMRNFAYTNNPRVNRRLSGYLLFHPKKETLPPLKIGAKAEIGDYESVVQSFRMWDAKKGILWKKGKSVYSGVALVGVDEKSRILFFFHPELVDVHDLVQRVLRLKLGLRGLLYLEGGTHGALYLEPGLGKGWNTGIALPNLLGLKIPRD